MIRRDFLLDMARAAIAASLVGCAYETSQFVHLSAAEARTMRAFAAQIIPSEIGAPGAEEAGAVYFVDQAFGDPFFADAVPLVRSGLAELDARGFSSLSKGEQRSVMRAIEHEPFFAAARMLVLSGTFRGEVGARIMQMEHRMSYTAPYGWYDAHV